MRTLTVVEAVRLADANASAVSVAMQACQQVRTAMDGHRQFMVEKGAEESAGIAEAAIQQANRSEQACRAAFDSLGQLVVAVGRSLE